jgi:hypothetical protein
VTRRLAPGRNCLTIIPFLRKDRGSRLAFLQLALYIANRSLKLFGLIFRQSQLCPPVHDFTQNGGEFIDGLRRTVRRLLPAALALSALFCWSV